MLELHGVSFEVDGKKALSNISLAMEDSRFIVTTSPNSDGRSTLVKLIVRIEKPTEGRILFDREDIAVISIDERAKRRIGYASQQSPRFKGMGACKLSPLAHGKDLNGEICCSYLTDVELCPKDYLSRGIDTSLPGGEVKWIEIASILARDLKFPILDELEAGIDLWNFAKLVETFQELQRESRQSIILISHQERTMQLVDEIIIIENGAIKTKGKRDGILPSLTSESDSCEFKKQVRQMKQMEKNPLKTVADISGFMPDSAFSLRKNGAGVERHSMERVKILTRTDKPGTDITVGDNMVGEGIYIPVILTDSGIQDMAYSDFYIGEDAGVETIVGCDIHNDGCDTSQHGEIHTSRIGRNISTTYTKRHYGEGNGSGGRILNPTIVIHMEEGFFAKTDMSQVKGVDSTFRKTEANLGTTAKLVINKKLMTHGEQKTHSDVTAYLNGKNSAVQIVSRFIGKDTSVQVFHPIAVGNNRSRAHIQYDSVVMGKAKISSMPEIAANRVDTEIIHEAAIRKINNDQLIKLQALRLNSEETEKVIVDSFLKQLKK